MTPLALSLVVGLLATLLALPLAVLGGWLLARRSFPGKVLVETGLMLPLVVPPVVTGWMLLALLGRRGILWPVFRPEISFTPVAAVIAAAVMGFPLALRACRLAFEQVDPRMEAVARTLGAGRVRTFLAVSLPLAKGGVVAAAILAFARSLGEFGATMVFAGNVEGRTRTLPLEVWTRLQGPEGLDDAWRPALLSVALALLLLAAGEWALGRRPA